MCVRVQGFVMNIQPSEAEAGFDLRLPPTADPDEIRKRIAEEWAPAVRNMSYTVSKVAFYAFGLVLCGLSWIGSLLGLHYSNVHFV